MWLDLPPPPELAIPSMFYTEPVRNDVAIHAYYSALPFCIVRHKHGAAVYTSYARGSANPRQPIYATDRVRPVAQQL